MLDNQLLSLAASMLPPSCLPATSAHHLMGDTLDSHRTFTMGAPSFRSRYNGFKWLCLEGPILLCQRLAPPS